MDVEQESGNHLETPLGKSPGKITRGNHQGISLIVVGLWLGV